MKKNSVRTSSGITKKASRVLRESKNKDARSIAASVLSNRRKK